MEVEKDYQMTQKIEPEEKEQTKPDTEKGKLTLVNLTTKIFKQMSHAIV